MTLAVLAAAPASAAAALENAIRLRRSGTHFALALELEDPRSARVRELSRSFCARYGSWDEVRLAFDGAAAEIAALRTTLAPDVRASLREAARLADALRVPSWSAYQRLTEALGPLPREVDVVLDPDPHVPVPQAGQGGAVVVYAPESPADDVGHLLAALADVQLPLLAVTAQPPAIPHPARWVPPAGAADALAAARLVVDASGKAATALALAAYGVPLAASSASGAFEALTGICVYEPWDRRSILAAVADGLAGRPPDVRGASPRESPRERAAAAWPADAPLVSVVVATHDRPALLAETLAGIERQTYPQLEIVVVNDAGADVRDVVARFPRARLLDQPENRGPAAARNRGLAEARGTFAILFDDDDEMFPDHVAALAAALVTSGLDVAYGQLINAFARRDAGDGWTVERYAGFEALLDHVDIQWAGALATTAVMFRRTLIERIGGLDESMIAAEDYEFWYRLAEGREWARVPDVTSIYFIRGDGSNRSQRRVANYFLAHRAIYERHPSPRPLVAAGRRAMLELFAQTASPASG